MNFYLETAGRAVTGDVENSVCSDGVGGGAGSTQLVTQVAESRHFFLVCVELRPALLTKTAERRHLLLEI